jgi:Ca2+-binding RTX toxin-like protein
LSITHSGWSSARTERGNGADRVYGGSGQDTLNGQNGNDWIDGNDGNDTCRGGVGTDTLYGGQGQDSLFGDDAADSLFGQNGDDLVDGGAGNDYIEGGTGAADNSTGGSGTNLFATCETPAGSNACVNSTLDGRETDVDCGRKRVLPLCGGQGMQRRRRSSVPDYGTNGQLFS